MSAHDDARGLVPARWPWRLLLVLLGAGCGDDDYAPYRYIGHACRDDFDCAPGIDCETGRDFPDGTCTVPCRDHFDCPRGTACVDVRGGVCLVYCSGDRFCRDEYDCQARDDREGSGESQVCIR
jgi:hypothetical protein